MPKLPRQLSGRKLISLLKRYGYKKVRETGSHIRLISNYNRIEHKITIPDHSSIKIKTLNNILNDIADYLEISKDELAKNLF